MQSLLDRYQSDSWFNGKCSVCGKDTRVIRFITNRTMVIKTEFLIDLCSDCAIYTSGCLLDAWGFVPRKDPTK